MELNKIRSLLHLLVTTVTFGSNAYSFTHPFIMCAKWQNLDAPYAGVRLKNGCQFPRPSIGSHNSSSV